MAVGSGAGPAVSIISAPSNALEDGEAEAGAAPVPTELVCTTSAAASASGVATDWAARGNPGGGGGGTKSDSRYWVPAETRRRSAPRRAASAYLPRGKEANLFRASGKVMFSVTFMFIIFFSN